MAGEAAGSKKQRDQLRAALRDQGCTPEQIAAEMSRQFSFRARQAWRHAYGWTQDEVAAAYNRHLGHDQAPMTGKRISDYEAWPHGGGGKKPTINALAMLARVYSTGVLNLVDLDDRQAFSPQELITLDTHKTSSPPAAAVAPKSPDMRPENSTQNPTTVGEGTAQPESNISITVHQAHTPEATTPSQRHRWHLILAWFLAIATATSAMIIAQKTMTGSHPTMPPSAAVPSATESPPLLVGTNADFCIATLTCTTTIAPAGTDDANSTSAVIHVSTGSTRRTPAADTAADTAAPSDNVLFTTGTSDAAHTATHPRRSTTATVTIADHRSRNREHSYR